MGANKPAALVVFLAGAVFAFSQPVSRGSESPVLFAAETAAVKNKLADAKLPRTERKTVLETLARLCELSGNAEGAAEAWLEASSAGPGAADHNALFRAARSFAALGEFDRAVAALKPILESAESPVRNQARFLAAQVEALSGGGTAGLADIAGDPAFAGLKPVAYYTMWRVSGDASVRSRLLAEYPHSPEARIIRSEERGSSAVSSGSAAGGSVNPAPTALWFFVPLALDAAEKSPAAAVPAARNAPLMFQTGVFGREENAQAMAERLRQAGFDPMVHTKKNQDGAERWAVGAAPGPDPSHTLVLLKNRGFEAFPVY